MASSIEMPEEARIYSWVGVMCCVTIMSLLARWSFWSSHHGRRVKMPSMSLVRPNPHEPLATSRLGALSLKYRLDSLQAALTGRGVVADAFSGDGMLLWMYCRVGATLDRLVLGTPLNAELLLHPAGGAAGAVCADHAGDLPCGL